MITDPTMRLWLDDYRPMPADYDVHVKTAADAIRELQTGRYTAVSLDYDLGHQDRDQTGYAVACWIARAAYHDTLPRIEWHVHSDNVQGREKILRAMAKAEKYWQENEHFAAENAQ